MKPHKKENIGNRVLVGRFGRPHGIKGYLTVHSFTHPRQNIIDYFPWQLWLSNQWQLVHVEQFAFKNKTILVKIEGYNDRTQAEMLTNVDIAIFNRQLPELEPGEYYWHQLIGMEVHDQGDVSLGLVEDIMPTGANDVLVIKGNKGRCLIPYVPGKFILSVDNERRIITVDWQVDL